ncbi:probable serine/threonine protein kinase IRE3 [Physcomitrium patens]|uniref:non-specific serine/threonine protein kinase n=1 Tax=Physcomitrium patens TaxID=3218 RepID=A0A2K1IMA3_PHYPA|nr:probable serine/threonine protein kinase IREH1 isoform X2 [Physcomitrium patens]PNR30404.1 hypothetical protein PHYPA_026720 [Physcomitrium patens]|eukprot:XP_024361260.1 probable serine/threonine protein kinase IREH1 isoform X2 [Physcomitrella patens]
MGPFSRATVGLIASKDSANKKKKKQTADDAGGSIKGGRRTAGSLPSWVTDGAIEETPVNEGKEKSGKEGKEKSSKEGKEKDKWKERIKESKEKSKKGSTSGKGKIDEDVEMTISAPILDEDFRLATSLLGLHRIKTRSGPLLFPPSTRSGPVYAGTFQSRFDTGNEGRQDQEKAVNSWSKGESSSRLLAGVGKASKVHARDSVSPEDFTTADDGSKSNRGRMLMYTDISEMGASPQSDGSPGSSNVKKLHRSLRIGDAGGRINGSSLRFEGHDDSNVPQRVNPFESNWADGHSNSSAGLSSREGGTSGCLYESHSFLRDSKSISDQSAENDAEAESPTESPRFKALLRMTKTNGKRHTDIKSFSHELDPRGLRSHEFLRPHNFGGFNGLEEFVRTLKARFNTAKEEVNAELAVFAGDLIEFLEKNADAAPDWRVRAEDLLILAKQCATMDSQEFRKNCEAIVHDLDEKRQELPMGALKQLHTRMLFILTRCTRLLQYQKRNFLESDPLRIQKVEKFWHPVDNQKVPASEPVKRKACSQELYRRNDVSTGRWTKDENISKLTLESIKEAESKIDSLSLNSSDFKDETADQQDAIVIERPTSWKKFEKDKIGSDNQSSPEKSTLQVAPTTKRRTQSTPVKCHSGDDTPMVICRICEEEVPTVHLEEHSRVCAFADRCDQKGMGVDERLRRLAATLERIVESYTPKSSAVAASASPDTGKTLPNCGDSENSLADKLGTAAEKFGQYERGGGDLLRRGSEDMLEDLHEIDTASILDEPRVFNTIACKSRFGPKNDTIGAVPSSVGSLLAPSSSVGSLTPRSPLTTPKNNHIDLLLADKNYFAESEDLQQINELVDIALCIADTNQNHPKAAEFIISCMEDLNDVLEQNTVDALTVDTFGRRIDKLCREKYQQILEASGLYVSENLVHSAEGSLSLDEEGSHSSKCTPVHPTHKDRTTIDDFEIIKPISRGAFGRVFLARKRITGDLFAIKVLRKADMIRKNAVESVKAERNILISVRNPFVVRFFYSFTCSVNLYLVMEYLNGGDLFSLLRNLGCLEEEMARVYIAEIVLALEYLHGSGIVHRDLKPDNLLIAHDGHIKLTDFGLSKVGLINSTDDLSGPAVGGATLMEEITKHHKVPSGELPQQRERRQQRSAVGTPDYLAPEILLGNSHGPAADWWSTGVILFEMLTGVPPFNAEHPQIIFDNILNRNIPWPYVPEEMSYEAQDLIDRLLTEDPDYRLGAKGAAEVKAHPFFKDINWDTLAMQKAAFVPSVDNIHDTSYFTSRQCWNSDETRLFADHNYESSNCETSDSGGSTSSSEMRPEDSEVIDVACPLRRKEGRDLSEVTPSSRFSFSNFSFKNLSQLASINYDLLQTAVKDVTSPQGRQS